MQAGDSDERLPCTNDKLLRQTGANQPSHYGSMQASELQTECLMMTIDDVITISSDDETNTEDECDISGLYNDRFDESLPSIAEISESVIRTAHVRRPNTGKRP